MSLTCAAVIAGVVADRAVGPAPCAGDSARHHHQPPVLDSAHVDASVRVLSLLGLAFLLLLSGIAIDFDRLRGTSPTGAPCRCARVRPPRDHLFSPKTHDQQTKTVVDRLQDCTAPCRALAVLSADNRAQALLASYFIVISLRCQASSVAGVTGKISGQPPGEGPCQCREPHPVSRVVPDRLRWRRSTAFSCRSTSSSAVIARSPRNTSAATPRTWHVSR